MRIVHIATVLTSKKTELKDLIQEKTRKISDMKREIRHDQSFNTTSEGSALFLCSCPQAVWNCTNTGSERKATIRTDYIHGPHFSAVLEGLDFRIKIAFWHGEPITNLELFIQACLWRTVKFEKRVAGVGLLEDSQPRNGLILRTRGQFESQ